MPKSIAKFSEAAQTVFHFGEVKTLPERTVFSVTEGAMKCEKINPVKGVKEQYVFAVAYFVYRSKRQEETVAVPVSALKEMPMADSSKKEMKTSRLSLADLV